MEKSVIERVLLRASETGADFAELFVEQGRDLNFSMGAGKVHSISSDLENGAGIRLFKGDFTAYAYTNDLSEQGLMDAAKKASLALNDKKLISSVNLVRQDVENKHFVKETLFSKTHGDLIDFMRQASDKIYQTSSFISRVDIGLQQKQRHILIANSEGRWVEDDRNYALYGLVGVAEKGSEKFSDCVNVGGMCGCEIFDVATAEEKAEVLAKNCVEMLGAQNCPIGKMPVVLDPHVGGVLIHEACGHSLEATCVAKNASVFANRLGEQVANEKVTLIDDGTLPNSWGSTNIDDEGEKTQRNVLIKNGILQGYLIDKFNGRKMGMKPTGSSRRQDYTFVPTSRMNNTFVDNGPDNPKEILASTDHGIYVAQISGGSVQPQSGEFNFSMKRAYLIENGKLTTPLKGAKLIGTGAELLQNIVMVGNDLGYSGPGRCGSVSGWVPVGKGVPTLKVREMTVGGQKA